MKHNIRQLISEYHMISPGDRIVCAVSGGVDSMVLLCILSELAPELGFSLEAAHFNHNLRGAESDRDAAFVSAYCSQSDIPLHCGSGDVLASPDLQEQGLEAAARNLRYDFFSKLSCDRIATAHNADDVLETLIIHLIQGCSLTGLSGIPPVRGNLIRPMLRCSRKQILQYAEEHGIPHVEDSSNLDDAVLRNRIRHHIVPLLEKENPAVAAATSDLCLRLRDDDALLSELTQSALSERVRGSVLRLDCWGTLSPSLQRRILRQFLSPVPRLTSGHISAVLALAAGPSPSAQYDLPGGFRVCRSYDSVRLVRKEEDSAPPDPVVLTVPGSIFFGGWEIHAERGLPAEHPDCLCIFSGHDSILIRSIHPGDRFRRSGGTKKLSRYFIDMKIPLADRPLVPLAELSGEIAAVLPLEVSAAFSSGNESDCICIHCSKRKKE